MLKTRVITAIILAVLFISALFFLPQKAWILFCAAILATAAWEWAALVAMSSVARIVFAGAIATAGVFIAWEWPSPSSVRTVGLFYAMAAVFWCVLMPLWLKNGLRFGTQAVLTLSGCIVLPACFFAMVQLRAVSPVTLLQFMAIVWLADSAAYFSGRKFGKRKLAPLISPGKTWEGAAGAMVAVTVYGVAWLTFFDKSIPASLRDTPLGAAAILVALWILAIFSICGDLFESALKRRAGVKDSGKILPGHGGILDRIDALLPVLPLSAVLFSI